MNKHSFLRAFRVFTGTLVGSAALLGAMSGTAAASGFEAARFGSVNGNAAGATPFALYYNPAALATTERIHIAGNLTLALRDATFTRASSDTSEPAGAVGANTGKASLFNVLSAPAFAASMRYRDWAFGLGFFVPFGGQASWDTKGRSYSGYPGAQDGVARWWLQDGSTSVMYASAGASYTIRPIRLSLGASANFTYTSVSLTRGLTSNGLNNDSIAAEGRTNIDVSGASGSFGVGALWEAVAGKVWAGLSYQAPPGMYKDQKLDGKLKVAFSDQATLTNVQMHMSLPDVIRFGLRVRPKPNYELRFNGDFTRWSVLKQQCLAKTGTSCAVNADGSDSSAPSNDPQNGNVRANQLRNWKNGFGLNIGGSYFFTPALEAFAGLGYDSGAIRMRTLEPSVIDGISLSGTLGGRIRVAQLVSFLLSYTHQGFLERDSTGKNRLADSRYPTALPDAGGVYTQWIGTFNGMVEVQLK